MTELEKFDALLKKTMSVSKEELQRRIEAEKLAKQKPSSEGFAPKKWIRPS